MRLKRGHLIGGAMILAVSALGVLLMRPTPIVVDAVTVNRARLESTVDAEGRTRVRDRYVVVAPVAGRVQRITRVEGSLVRAGEIIAVILPLPMDSATLIQARSRLDVADATLIQAAAEIRIATAQLDQRSREVGRAERLADVGGVAPRVVEEARLAHVEAEESVRVARERARAADADAKQARATLAGQESNGAMRTIVRAPANGRVLRVPERSERIVVAGATLIELGDPSSLEVVVEVLSSDAGVVHPGDRVRLGEWVGAESDEGAQHLGGRVREIEPSGFTKVSALGVEEQRVRVIVDLDHPPPVVGDGFRVEASIIVWANDNVVVVPRSALIQGGANGSAGWTAFVVRGGRIQTQLVRVGHAGATNAEVLGGIGPGDQVVVFPSDRLSPGVRVKVRQNVSAS